jgi:hypothetical protein
MKTRPQARLMRRSGCSCKVIANRLHITPRHARRLCEGIERRPSGLVGTDHEIVLWRTYYRRDRSYLHVAHRFGLSRQHVCDALSANDPASL